MQNRKNDLLTFYLLIDSLRQKIGGNHLLSECSGRTNFPSRGVYFFMEQSEIRTDTGSGARIVRVGTHALKSGSKSTLWQRLSQHKGTATSGGGNHRGSIFRLLIGTTFADKHCDCSTWGQGSTAKGEVRLQEQSMELEVSAAIRKMPFVYLSIDDAPTSNSLRGIIERNSIALLSNFQRPPLDPSSKEWRGNLCDREKVRLSGLWNQNHVNETYDPSFLPILETLINQMKSPT